MRSIRTRFLVAVSLGAVMAFLLDASYRMAQAAPTPRWIPVQVDPNCFGSPIFEDRTYLYNVDENDDGVVDFAVWFHESDRVSFVGTVLSPRGTPFRYRHSFLLAEPHRSLHQWAFAWFGYRATGACNANNTYGHWEIRPSPQSTYAKYPKRPHLELSVQIGVAAGSTFRVKCHPFPLHGCTGVEYLLQPEYWSASPGAWYRDNLPAREFYNPFYSPHGGWKFSDTDWETLIQQGGHPPYPLQYPLAESSTVPQGSWCVRSSGPGEQPYGELDVNEHTGSFLYSKRGKLVQVFFMDKCWIVDNGPTAAFTNSPSLPSAGQTVTFDGSLSADPDGVISFYTWEFGDGIGSSGAVAPHAYASPGTYTVSLTVTDNSGRADTARRQVTVGATLIGSVRDAAARLPIAGAYVRVYNSHRTYSASTLSDGSYRIGGIVPDSYTVETSKCGYRTSSQVVSLAGNPSPMNFNLTRLPTGTLSGYVKDAAGVPISGATVHDGYCGKSMSTDTNGYYRLDLVADVTLTAWANAVGYRGDSATVSVPAGGSRPQDFTLLEWECGLQRCPE